MTLLETFGEIASVLFVAACLVMGTDAVLGFVLGLLLDPPVICASIGGGCR